jgi:hypothetical protein
MLGFPHTLVTSDTIQALCDLWPGCKAVERLKRAINENGTGRIDGGRLELSRFELGVNRATQYHVTEDLVQLLVGKPPFNKLSSSGYTESL